MTRRVFSATTAFLAAIAAWAALQAYIVLAVEAGDGSGSIELFLARILVVVASVLLVVVPVAGVAWVLGWGFEPEVTLPRSGVRD